MMSVPSGEQTVVHRDAEELATSAASRLIHTLREAQSARGVASLALTGGRNGNGLLSALATAPDRDSVDWARVDFWWSDERFLPEGHPERNSTQAHSALLDRLPVDPARLHPMGASDGTHAGDVTSAAAGYAAELAAATADMATAAGSVAVPAFDVLLLGVGPDTHVASLFPTMPAVRESERTVVGVRDAPKPPPERVSLTLPAIRAAREVWLLAAGQDKAEAVARTLPTGGEVPASEAPAAHAHGRERTLWLLDEAAAAALPSHSRPRTAADGG